MELLLFVRLSDSLSYIKEDKRIKESVDKPEAKTYHLSGRDNYSVLINGLLVVTCNFKWKNLGTVFVLYVTPHKENSVKLKGFFVLCFYLDLPKAKALHLVC